MPGQHSRLGLVTRFWHLTDADDSAPRNAAPCIQRDRKQIAPNRNSFSSSSTEGLHQCSINRFTCVAQ
jgi:hypothetical protein